jgi:hypothetical protein
VQIRRCAGSSEHAPLAANPWTGLDWKIRRMSSREIVEDVANLSSCISNHANQAFCPHRNADLPPEPKPTQAVEALRFGGVANKSTEDLGNLLAAKRSAEWGIRPGLLVGIGGTSVPGAPRACGGNRGKIMDEIEVLTVGAGPTGLALALFLTRLGMRTRIIDKAAEPGTTSRALVFHARNLEFYEQIGLASLAIAESVKFTAVNLWAGGKLAACRDWAIWGHRHSPGARGDPQQRARPCITPRNETGRNRRLTRHHWRSRVDPRSNCSTLRGEIVGPDHVCGRNLLRSFSWHCSPPGSPRGVPPKSIRW